MKLGDLVSRLSDKMVLGDPTVEVAGLAYHSREVKEGFLFAALRGLQADGNRFIPEALARGARALLVEELAEGAGATQVVVPRAREALARLASAFWGDPSLSLTVVGITGTNGKTTTSYLLESIFAEAGKITGVVGTVNYRYAGRTWPAATTTPESLDLQRLLAEMRAEGVTHAVLEVSSHALDLRRVEGCHFDAALFTNLTRDHLDYHGSMGKYFEAKKLLFTEVLRESRKKNLFSVINADDPRGEELCRSAPGTVFRYGIKSREEIYPRRFLGDLDGIRAEIVTPRGALEIAGPLIGLHNLANILAAVSVAEALGIPSEITARGVEKMGRVPGRLDWVPGGGGLRIFVDYAHTPDALERALETLRSVRPARLFVIFGCGGDRDRGKRPTMGRAAALGSDFAVATSDNPRSENPRQILAEIEGGIRETGRPRLTREEFAGGGAPGGYVVIADRREAIMQTVNAARPGDVILIAGKGHEDYQILGATRIHFDDREEALAALKLRKEKSDL